MVGTVRRGHNVGSVGAVDDGAVRVGAGSSAGSRAALAGLHATRPNRRRLRRAVTAALFGLSLLGGQPVQAHPNDQRPLQTQHNELVLPPAPPPRWLMPELVPVWHEVQAGQTQVSVRAKPPAHEVDPGKPHQGLPDTLATLSGGTTVVHGTDPGDFYCEHAFFTTTEVARAPGSTVLRDAQGEVLTGFLHSPGDAYTYDASQIPVQAERHRERAEVVGAAIRGFFESARDQIGDKPFKMLLTGYGAWGGTVNNPTGDFVLHTENVDAAMKAAFGSALTTPQGTVVDGPRSSGGGESTVLRYRILDPQTGAPRTVTIDAALLPVSDAAINGSPVSLQALMDKLGPHAVLSMGVSGGSGSFVAEFHADDGGLAVVDGKPAHDDAKDPDRSQPDNYALARAILAGRLAVSGGDPTDPRVTSIGSGGGP